jgi:hypothetical protein
MISRADDNISAEIKENLKGCYDSAAACDRTVNKKCVFELVVLGLVNVVSESYGIETAAIFIE